MSTIKSSSTITSAVAAEIESIANGSSKVIDNYDDDTTITANGSAQESFMEGVDSISVFENHMLNEAQNLRRVGFAFDEVDKMCASLQKGI